MFYNSGALGLGINMTAYGDRFSLVFKQSFPSDKYVKAFAEGLKGEGISYMASNAIEFTIPGDGLRKRKDK